MTEKLEEVREWAQAKIATGAEPPWAWYQYMKLIETLDTILKGMDSISPTASSQLSESHPGKHLRLVGAMCSQDTARPHPADLRPQLPM